MILGPDGRPIQTEARDPGLEGGWTLDTGLNDPINWIQQIPGARRPNVERDVERRIARAAYFINPLFSAGITIIINHLLGDEFTYGNTDDRRLDDHLDEMWTANSMSRKAARLFTEFLLDGEHCTVFEEANTNGDVPLFAFVDPEYVVVESDTFRGVTEVRVNLEGTSQETYTDPQMVWDAHDALYNDPRGWSPTSKAARVALSYTNLLNHRVRAWELQARINLIYKALVQVQGSDDAGLSQLVRKAARYQSIPRDGSVITLAMDAVSGKSETLETLEPGKGAASAKEDARLIHTLFAAVIGMPEHFLGEGGNVTRTTADSMGDPARKGFKRWQSWGRETLTRIYRNSLKIRYGENQRYSQRQIRVRDEGRTRVVNNRRVTADEVDIPWVFPDLSSDDAIAIARKLEVLANLGLASRQTMQGIAGLDPALENERISREGGDPNRNPSTPTEPADRLNSTPTPEEEPDEETED